jgi:CheY-like chemotaxis protein
MPGMTGVELAREVYAIRPQVPVILCTGYSHRVGEEQADTLNIQRSLAKPTDMDTLARALQEVLRARQTTRR